MQDEICQIWADCGRKEPKASVKLLSNSPVLILDSDTVCGQQRAVKDRQPFWPVMVATPPLEIVQIY